MKTVYLLSICFWLTGTIAFGQSKDELELRRLETHWTELLDQGDIPALLEIWSDEYVVNNPNGKIVTPKEIVALMESGHKFPEVKRFIEKITFNKNVAIIMGKELQQPKNMTPNLEEWIPRRFTNVWIKMGDNWKLAARQSTQVDSQN